MNRTPKWRECFTPVLRVRSIAGAMIAVLAGWLSGSAQAQPSGLTKADIADPANTPAVSQLVTNADGSFTVTAGGNDTWDASDSFTFLYEQKDGDFEVKVQVLDVQVDDPAEQDSGKGAIMARVNLTPGSPNVQVNALPANARNQAETIYRPAQDVGTDDMPDRPSSNSQPFLKPFPDVWLRMRRAGNSFTTYRGDGTQWQVLSEVCVNPAEFPKTIYVGLSTVAHVSLSETQTDRVHVTYRSYGDMPVPPPATVNGQPAGDQAPGTYPNASVTAINWKVELPADGIGFTDDLTQSGPIIWNTGGFGAISRDILVSIDGEGPIRFSLARYACGALDLGIGPRDAVAAQSNLGPYSNPNRRRYASPTASLAAAQAWFPSPKEGLLFSTVRKTGQLQWNDGAAPFYPFTFVAQDFSSSSHYSMIDGTFGNGDFYVRMAKMGDTGAHPNPQANSSGGFQRAAFDTSVAWFPFHQGWKGGYVADASVSAPGAAWRQHGSHSDSACAGITNKNSAAEIVTWVDLGGGTYGGLAELKLAGVNSLADGMLFLAANDDNTTRGSVANLDLKPDGSGWVVAIRNLEENKTNINSYATPDTSEFSFLFVPYRSHDLIGGYINGTNGSTIKSAGNFTVTRLEAGRYQLSIAGKTGSQGMLLLQMAGFSAATPALVGSYEYGANNFIIECRFINPGGGTGGFDAFPLRDANFYFAWVDFAKPLSPESCATPVVPAGGSPPGPCPDFSVTAANWIARGDSSGFTGDVRMGLDGHGPIPWSIIRYNRGDLAVRLSPLDPVNALTNLNLGFTQFDNAETTQASGQVWGPHRDAGVIIPTARQNGPIDWGDGQGPFYPTIGAGTANSTGNGYDMVDGTFHNFGGSSPDMNTGKAGDQSAEPSPEGNFDFATTWFPYHQGWLGGVVGNPNTDGSAQWVSPGSHSPGLLPTVVSWPDQGGGLFGGAALLSLPGVNSLNDGMLFTTSSDGNSDVNIMASAPKADGSGWVISIREDSTADPQVLDADDQNEFQFVYIPYASGNLIGGHINGNTGAKINARGNFTVARTGAGSYELSIPDKTGTNGVLLLQNADFIAGSTTVADNNFLSYEYNAAAAKFIIQARHTTGPTGIAPLEDTDFYVAWVDFVNPLTPPGASSGVRPAELTIGSITRSGLNLTITWSGGTPPYQVQTRASLSTGSWSDVGVPTNTSSVSVTIVGTEGFFRIRGQ